MEKLEYYAFSEHHQQVFFIENLKLNVADYINFGKYSRMKNVHSNLFKTAEVV